MNKLKGNLIFVIAASVFTIFLTQYAQAQTLPIGNSQSNPAFVRDVDAYARRPVVVEVSVSPKDGQAVFDGDVTAHGIGSGAGPQEIPKGYRFVVEYIWANATLVPGEMLNVDLSLPLVGKRDGNATYSFALKDGLITGIGTRSVVFHASYEKAVRIYLDPGEVAARFSFQQTLQPSQFFRSAAVYLSGYLEKVAQAHPRPGPVVGAAMNGFSPDNDQ